MLLVWVSGLEFLCGVFAVGGGVGKWERVGGRGLTRVCVCTGWNCYLSYVNSQGGKEKIVDVFDKEG